MIKGRVIMDFHEPTSGLAAFVAAGPYTQESLAQEIGCSVRALQLVGATEPPLHDRTRRKIAAWLGCTPDLLTLTAYRWRVTFGPDEREVRPL